MIPIFSKYNNISFLCISANAIVFSAALFQHDCSSVNLNTLSCILTKSKYFLCLKKNVFVFNLSVAHILTRQPQFTLTFTIAVTTQQQTQGFKNCDMNFNDALKQKWKIVMTFNHIRMLIMKPKHRFILINTSPNNLFIARSIKNKHRTLREKKDL